MNGICIVVLMTVMICCSGCGPSEQEAKKPKLSFLATQELLELLETQNNDLASNLDAIQVLISKGANVNGSDRKLRTPLMLAFKHSHHPAIATLLIEAGADVNAENKWGGTTLMSAARYCSYPPVFALLIEKGADVNAGAGGDFGVTSLMIAAEHSKRAEIITLLIEAGADVNAKAKSGMMAGRSIRGWTALMFAALNDSPPEIVSLLIEAGADVNAKDDNGDTLLTLIRSAHWRSPEIIKILKAAGARE